MYITGLLIIVNVVHSSGTEVDCSRKLQ